jgi:hypothetical protein
MLGLFSNYSAVLFCYIYKQKMAKKEYKSLTVVFYMVKFYIPIN